MLAVLMTSGAAAAAPASVKQKEKTAKRLCSQGDYQEGVQILAELFVETSDPTYVYNQGRCYQQNGRAEQALNRFREYLRQAKDLPPGAKAGVERYIAECEADLGKSPEAKPVVAPTPASTAEHASESPSSPSPPIESHTPPPPPDAPLADVAARAPAPDAFDGRGLRIAGLVTAAVGVAALAGGVAFNLAANHLDDQIAAGKYTRDKAASRDRDETLGWISYGVGAAAVVTGATLYLLGWRSAPNATMAVFPTFGPSEATLSVRGVY
jgi:tetratricopeptide (TPR) repeat protein